MATTIAEAPIRVLIAVLFFAGVIDSFPSANGCTQAANSLTVVDLSTPEIASRMTALNLKRAAALNFTSQRIYELDYTGFPSHKHARIVVDAHVSAPQDKKLEIVSEEGSELLLKHVLRKLVQSELEASDRNNYDASALTNTNYQFSWIGHERIDGRNCYVLSVKPRTRSRFLYEGKIWIDQEHFAVVHIQARPSKNPSFWIKKVDIEHRYEKVGPFWLPVSNRSVSSTRLGGRAVLTINYGQYKLGGVSPAQFSIEGTHQGAIQ